MVIPFPAVAATVGQSLGGQVIDRLASPPAPLVFRSETNAINPWWFVLGAVLVWAVVRNGR